MQHNDTLQIIRPDDWHLHVRSGEMLKSVIGMTALQMGRAIIMPNLTPPVSDAGQAQQYHQEIMNALPADTNFTPLMVLYLTDNTTPEQIQVAVDGDLVVAAKLYPAGATTNSDSGVTDIANIYPALEKMQQLSMPLLVHGEVTDAAIDIFDREAVFIERILIQVVQDFPELKIVFEHITTKDAVDFVLSAGENIAATITPHHLLANRNDMLVGGIKPHYFACQF
jgi:dihydroorotase (EC 3.5.2.3)